MNPLEKILSIGTIGATLLFPTAKEVFAETNGSYYQTLENIYCDKEQIIFTKLQPPYELTQEQREFLNHEENKRLRNRMWCYDDTFLKYADDIKNGKLTGSPLQDCALLIYQQNIIPLDKRKELSSKFNISMEDIDIALGIYALEIIDGKPEYIPSQKGLHLLHNSGIIQIINKNWNEFSEKYMKEVYEKRSKGEGYVDDLTFDALNELIGPYDLGRCARSVKENLKVIVGIFSVYVETRLFQDIPQSEKLVKYPDYLKLEEIEIQ